MKTIAVIQVKGGAGRTTLSTTIAGQLTGNNRVLLIDCDMPQGTAQSWAAMRAEQPKLAQLTIETAADHRELLEKVDRLGAGFDFVILDGPPRIAEISRTAIALADLCLIPVGASLAELWATTDVLSLLEQARAIREVDARLVWTRLRPGATTEQLEAYAATLGLSALKSTLGHRAEYVRALGEGRTADESRNRVARLEVEDLQVEVEKILRAQDRKRVSTSARKTASARA